MQTTAFLGVAHIHTPGFIKAINKRDDVACKYVYDHDAARAQKCADELSAQVANIETILADDEVTSVVICSETRGHTELVERVAQAGKHLFVEKPLATTQDEATRMASAIEAAGVVFQTGFFMRGWPANIFIKREVEAGNLGTITRMSYTNCHQGALAGWFDTDWRWIADKNEAGGGGFADLGAHALDIVLWCLAPTCGEVVKTAATLGNSTGRYGDLSAIDEWGVGLVTFENGAVGIVQAGWVDPKGSTPIEVHGTKGHIVVRDNQVFYYSENVEGADGGEWTDLPDAPASGFGAFWDKLAGEDVPLVSVQQAAQESGVMALLYDSV